MSAAVLGADVVSCEATRSFSSEQSESVRTYADRLGSEMRQAVQTATEAASYCAGDRMGWGKVRRGLVAKCEGAFSMRSNSSGMPACDQAIHMCEMVPDCRGVLSNNTGCYSIPCDGVEAGPTNSSVQLRAAAKQCYFLPGNSTNESTTSLPRFAEVVDDASTTSAAETTVSPTTDVTTEVPSNEGDEPELPDNIQTLQALLQTEQGVDAVLKRASASLDALTQELTTRRVQLVATAEAMKQAVNDNNLQEIGFHAKAQMKQENLVHKSLLKVAAQRTVKVAVLAVKKVFVLQSQASSAADRKQTYTQAVTRHCGSLTKMAGGNSGQNTTGSPLSITH